MADRNIEFKDKTDFFEQLNLVAPNARLFEEWDDHANVLYIAVRWDRDGQEVTLHDEVNGKEIEQSNCETDFQRIMYKRIYNKVLDYLSKQHA